MIKKRGVGFFAPPAVRLDRGSKILLEKMTQKEDFMVKEAFALDNKELYVGYHPIYKDRLIEQVLHRIVKIYILFMRNAMGMNMGQVLGFDAMTTNQIFELIGRIFTANRMTNYAYKSQIMNTMKVSFEWLENRCYEIVGGKNIYKEVFNKLIYED